MLRRGHGLCLSICLFVWARVCTREPVKEPGRRTEREREREREKGVYTTPFLFVLCISGVSSLAACLFSFCSIPRGVQESSCTLKRIDIMPFCM